MSHIENFGILAALSWNQNKWAGEPKENDRLKSNFKFVKEHGTLFESITFGHGQYKCEKDKTYIGYTPTFQDRLPNEKSAKDVAILFFRSLNPRRKQMYIVGFYAFPEFGQFNRLAKDSMYEFYTWGNIKAKVDDIICFETPIPISNDIVSEEKFLPPFKKISLRGWNYLGSNNVTNILKEALILNPQQNIIQKVKERLSHKITNL